jgi:hypothetical protein
MSFFMFVEIYCRGRDGKDVRSRPGGDSVSERSRLKRGQFVLYGGLLLRHGELQLGQDRLGKL